MKLKKYFWKIATVLVVGLLVLNPELLALGLFIDAIGLEMFLLLLEVQVVAVSGYCFQSWIKPVFMPVYKYLTKIDPYFFIPTRKTVKEYPLILCHAVPGLLVFVIGFVSVTSEIDAV